MMWSAIKVCIYGYEHNKWKYKWTNLYGLSDFHSWLNTARELESWNEGNKVTETQNYDGSLTIILYKKGKPATKYICKVSTTNDRYERR